MAQGYGNVFDRVPERLPEEQITELLTAPGLRIERIISTGQSSPEGYWYDQHWTEWVLVLAGSAGLLFDGEAEPRVLGPGDHVIIPARTRHRVEWTDAEQPTVWLAVHHGVDANALATAPRPRESG